MTARNVVEALEKRITLAATGPTPWPIDLRERIIALVEAGMVLCQCEGGAREQAEAEDDFHRKWAAAEKAAGGRDA